MQRKHPAIFLGVGVLSAGIALLLTLQLQLKTSFGELLPQNKESVIVARRVNERLSSASTLIVVLRGGTPEARRAAVDRLAQDAPAWGPDWVGQVDAGTHDLDAFIDNNKLLYAPLDALERVRDRIDERYAYEVNRRADLLLDESEPPPPEVTIDSLKQELQPGKAAATETKPPSDGYYHDVAKGLAVVVLKTPIGSGDAERSTALQQRVQASIAQASRDPSTAPSVAFTGNLITSAEEYSKIKGDLSHVGLRGVLLIVASVFLYFLRVRALLSMIAALTIGVLWTFAFTYLTIGHLNSSTGFLVSIVVGNGINFAIIYMERYLSSRKTNDPLTASHHAFAQTWRATAAAALAASVAYGSLVVTDFRGFKHFGIIGGAGMAFCWLSTYLFLPPVLLLTEQVRPVRTSSLLQAFRGSYGRPFAWLATRAPRAIMLASIPLTALACVGAWNYLAQDPMEYDMANTRNDAPKTESGARKLQREINHLLSREQEDGLAIMVDDIAQVPPLRAALEARLASAPEGKKPFEKIVTIFDLLPKDQEKKIEILQEIQSLLSRAHRKGFIPEDRWKELQDLIPDSGFTPVAIGGLPEAMTRAFREKDGNLGRLVYIVPASGRSVWDGRYLIEWAESFRRTELPDGSVILGSGQSVIFADMILTVVEDAPKAILASLIGTLIIIGVAFKRMRQRLAVMGSLLLGCVFTLGLLSISSVDIIDGSGSWWSRATFEPLRLNFLNFIAIPITIGVGADYAVNIVQRRAQDPSASIALLLRETGGAVVLCSLTTMLGYLALLGSINQAVRSFGLAAAIGEVACLCAAGLILPAYWAARGAPKGG